MVPEGIGSSKVRFPVRVQINTAPAIFYLIKATYLIKGSMSLQKTHKSGREIVEKGLDCNGKGIREDHEGEFGQSALFVCM